MSGSSSHRGDMGSTEREFARWKSRSEQRTDHSRKGAVDADIVPLVSLLNGLQQYFTTSSCSGRIILIDGSTDGSEVQKQNCRWLFVSHQRCSAQELVSAVGRSSADVVLKFEPFVLHVQCRRLDDAQLVHSVAVNSGFRNSGLTVGKTGKIMSAVRSTHGLEVPLTQQSTLMVTHSYIEFLCQICNKKMEENLRRINRFHENLQKALAADLPTLHVPECPSEQPRSGNKDRADEQRVYRRRRRRRREQADCCHDDGNGASAERDGGREDTDCSPTELHHCLDLFT